jgi:hypothetical protein
MKKVAQFPNLKTMKSIRDASHPGRRGHPPADLQAYPERLRPAPGRATG